MCTVLDFVKKKTKKNIGYPIIRLMAKRIGTRSEGEKTGVQCLTLS